MRGASRALALVVLSLAASLLGACGGGDRPFSSAEWKSLRAADRKGGRMVRQAASLVEGKTLLGRSKEEVLELLGDDDGATSRAAAPGDLEWLIEESWMLRCTVLIVGFSRDGRVTTASIVEVSY